MHYLLRLRLGSFYVRVLRRAGVAPVPDGLVVVREGVVLDCDERAAGRGVETGMAVRQARTILQGGPFREWVPDHYRRAQEVWLDVCCAFSDVIEPEDQHSAFLDLSDHPDPRGTAAEAIAAVARRTGLPVRWGLAPSKWLALLVSEAGDPWESSDDPLRYLWTLPVAALLPVPEEHRRRLRFLGYRKVGDVAAVPLEELRRQFGVRKARASIRRRAAGAPTPCGRGIRRTP